MNIEINKAIIPDGVFTFSIIQHDALGLGNGVLCAEHLLNNEPI
jgi:UTP-glucose-1-phosphate uridylyltransferase